MIIKIKKFFYSRASYAIELFYIRFFPKNHYIKDIKSLSINLSNEELIYLYRYVFHDKYTIYVDLCDPIMASLYTKSFTQRNVEKYRTRDGYGYVLNEWAREYLKNNLHLFDKCSLYLINKSRRNFSI